MERASFLAHQDKGDVSPARHPKTWRPAKFLAEGFSVCTRYAVIVLNQPVENPELFLSLSRGALYRVYADGGANRVRSLELSAGEELSCLPHAICGDLDSLSPEVRVHYESLGVKVVQDLDQYSTDLTKCFRFLTSLIRTAQSEQQREDHAANDIDIVILGGLGGRADQAFSQLHSLIVVNEDTTRVFGDTYLLTPESIVFLLYKGENRIETPRGPNGLGENVGIIPIAGPSVATTQGLEWDVQDWPTAFGSQVSTSNHIRSEEVMVWTTERVLFTVEIGEKPIVAD